ncbi:hypothetical protein [Nocardioides sambongensis]|uniref:hypothetical protein n=1 Tax=Nocardioides sambongensis TaxID=2589074 RepID=UPI00112C0836|nr:hypothetical protein [Nocardioides sambongensis]
MSVSATAASTPLGVRRARGLIAGLVAAFGALVAHVAAGGTVEVAPGLAVVAVAVPLGIVLTRADAVAPGRLLAVAGAAQLVGHLCLLMSPSGGGHSHHGGAAAGLGAAALPSVPMLAGHAAVALVVVGLTAGLDRAVLDLLAGLLVRLLPRIPGAVRPPGTTRTLALARPRVRRTRGVTATRSARGPPARPFHLRPAPLRGPRVSHASC